MKKTRKIEIADKVFAAEDLRRIADLFEKQQGLAKKSSHHARVEYTVSFDDRSTYQSNSPEVFDDDSFKTSSRPLSIQMNFVNYENDRQLNLSLSHGDWNSRNLFEISSKEESWLRDTFTSFQESIAIVKPQTIWLKNHQTLLLNLLALGIGHLSNSVLSNRVWEMSNFSKVVTPLPPDSPWRQVITPQIYLIFLWLMTWLGGIFPAWCAQLASQRLAEHRI